MRLEVFRFVPVSDLFTPMLETFGYLSVALVVGAESSGLPVPGETALVAAAAYAATGHLGIPLVILVALAAATVGSTVNYCLGSMYRQRALQSRVRLPRLDVNRLRRGEAFFHRHGNKTVIVARFLPFVRAYIGVLAAVNRMPFRLFLIYNTLGAVIWSVFFGMLGFALGSNLPLLERVLRGIGIATFGAVILVLAIAALLWARREGRWIFRSGGGT